jgi:PAS domain S-box-containing protein
MTSTNGDSLPVAGQQTLAKSITLLASAALLLALGVALTFWSFRQIEAAAQQRQHTHDVIVAADDLLTKIIDAETGQRGYLITGDEAFLAPYLAVRENISESLAKLRQLVVVNQAIQHLDAMAPLVADKLDGLALVIELRSKGDLSAAQQLVKGGEGRLLMDSIRAEIQSFTAVEEKVLARHEAEFESNMRRLFMSVLWGCVLILLMALGFAWMIYQQVQQRLKDQQHLNTLRLLDQQEAANRQLIRANDELRVSEEKLGVTLHSIGDGVIATDSLACVTMLNPVAEQLTGWTIEQAIGRPVDEVFNIINKETRLPAKIPVADALAHGTVQGLANHTVLIDRDGRECDIADSCAPIRDNNGQVVGAVLVFRNVTEEYEAQQDLRDSAALIQTILNTVVDGIITLRASDGLIETVNPAVEKMFGYSAAELIGQRFSLLVPEQAPDAIASALVSEPASEGGRDLGQAREVQGRCKNGRMFALEMTHSEMWLGGERHFTGILRDFTARKQAEEALLQAGALQKAIFDSANFSSIATDAKGVIQIFNVGAERMLGYTALEVLNQRTPADISDPQEIVTRAKTLSIELDTPIAPGFEALVFKASRGIEDIYELTYIRKDGSRFPAVVSVTALRDDDNDIIGYLLIGTDNTARKQAEEALLKAGALQRAIFNSANFSSIATDAKGVIQIFNVGAERMLGYAAADVMNKITPADISDPSEVIARANALSVELDTPIAPGFEALVFKASRGIEDIYELTYIREDGSRFPAVVSVTALRDAQETIIGYLLIGTDNTARKQIEAEQRLLAQRLRDQQFYTRSLFESNVDAIMTTDPSGIITDVNKQMEVLTGCTRDELIGAPFKNHFTDPERAGKGIERVLNEKKVTNYELTARSRDGMETVVSYNATTFYDRERTLQGVFAAARDVTEHKRLGQVLQEKNIELESARSVAEKANLAKSDFLSSMSHELRSPLNAILGFAQLMDSDRQVPTVSQKESLAQILQAGWHLLKLINEILDLAKVESRQVPLSEEPVLLADVLLECQSMIEPQAQQRGIRMVFPPRGTPHFVMADQTRLKQVVINLLSNAIKYNVSQGVVEVTYAQGTLGRLRVSIRDTGLGLSPEQLGQLFQAFNRLGQEAGLEEGTGIGLVVAKRLVELMGGVIGVESTVGVGSVFWFELVSVAAPLLAQEQAAQSLLPASTRREARRHTLLYVEDNLANMRLVEQIIARHPDIHLLKAVNGTLGVELARASQPDVILMDINLPGINGFDALRLLRADDLTAHIPVIALSANAMLLDIERGMKAGFFRYITKPIIVNEFVEALNMALEFASVQSDTRA